LIRITTIQFAGIWHLGVTYMYLVPAELPYS